MLSAMVETVREDVASFVRERAREFGFDRVGFAAARPGPHAEFLETWLARGCQGTMDWLARDPERRADPRRWFPEARTVVALATNYWSPDPAPEDPATGRISRYAWGEDYHEVVKERLYRLADAIREHFPGVGTRVAVDTAAVLEKPLAEAAGLGWVGKNTCSIREGEGSWFFLGEIALDVDLPEAEPAVDRCGTCRRCLDVCPTRAIVEPYVLDARRCISYLTIEHRGPIDRELRALFGNRIFGCDDCQDVCPWNVFAAPSPHPEFRPRDGNLAPLLAELLALDEEGFRRRFKGSPVKRARRDGFVRNVAIAIGNSGDPSLVEPLVRAAADPSPLVRGHVAWALGRLGAHDALRGRAEVEVDSWVREEVEAALGEGPRP